MASVVSSRSSLTLYKLFSSQTCRRQKLFLPLISCWGSSSTSSTGHQSHASRINFKSTVQRNSLHHFSRTRVEAESNFTWTHNNPLRRTRSLIELKVRHYAPRAETIDLSLSNNAINNYLQMLLAEYDKASEELVSMEDANEETLSQISKTLNRLKPITELYRQYIEKQREIEESEELIRNSQSSDSKDDAELVEMAKEEIRQISQAKDDLETQILSMLIPREKADHNDILLEVSAGVGGQEAMLFTEEIFQMYAKYATYKGWEFQVLSYETAEQGVRSASASIHGQDVFRHLKYDGGVHRVQRIPKTERSGRVHTSTMTVAILPQPTEIDIQIHAKDLKVQTFRSSGPGGQHVQKTDSAVRIVHLPTGITAECQQSRSQFKNKEIAMKVMRSRLYEKELEQQVREETSRRKLQVGTRGRSERIRTYNFNQDRITDHRLGENFYNVDEFLEGGPDLEDMIQMLQGESAKEALMDIIQQYTSKKS